MNATVPSVHRSTKTARRARPRRRIARDTLLPMSDVTIRELRNHGGDVINRVQAGEHVIITRSGTPVAELRPLARRGPEPASPTSTLRRSVPTSTA